MVDYPQRFINKEFIATVEACQTSVVNGGSISDRQMGWGDEAIEIDVSAALASITLSPDCGYDVTFEPVIRTSTSPDTFTALPPFSVSWSESTSTIFVSKCSQDVFSFDPECQNDPYEIVYDIVILVRATVDGQFTTNTELSFTVEIGNTCLDDTVTVQYLSTDDGTAYVDGSSINYVLASSVDNAMIITPFITQMYSFCPITASLTGPTQTGISFNQNTG